MLSTQVTNVTDVVFKLRNPVVSVNTATENLALSPLEAVVIFYTRMEFPAFVPEINGKITT